jgi:tyrosinase
MDFDRRSVLKASLTAAIAAYATDFSLSAVAEAPRKRFSATTTEGKAMLVKYAKAVGTMMDPKKIPVTDPRSWTFQWYTHWIPGPQFPWSAVVTAKDGMLKTVFPGRPATDPARQLAEAMWDTCQPHGANTSDPNFFQEMFFCVWHRWYLYYFEEIVRGVLADNTFTLPYWDYLTGKPSDLSLPPEFLDPKSPLYRTDRNPWVKAGERIDKFNPDTLNLNAFKENTYIGAGAIGFCPILDGNPHGLVHSYIGTATNMGQVPYAANDPIFWLHHCNLDRLWESWNRLPGMSNPAWPNRKFSFADKAGAALLAPASGADRVAALKYEYDAYYTPPKAPVAGKPGLEAARVKVTRAFAKAPVVLGSDQLTTTLERRTAAPARGSLESITAPPAAARALYLVLGNITAPAGTPTTFNVFWGRPDGAAGLTPRDPRFLGTLHFFGVSVEQHEGAGHEVAFNITDKVGALPGAGNSNAAIDISFVRRGPNPDGAPTVGQVALVEA